MVKSPGNQTQERMSEEYSITLDRLRLKKAHKESIMSKSVVHDGWSYFRYFSDYAQVFNDFYPD